MIKAFGKTVTTVTLELLLSGPKPWHASGKVSFRVIWRYTLRFDLTIGDQPATAPVERADLRSLLLAELRRPSSWSGQLPPSSGTAVALRDVRTEAGTDLLIHPQGRFGVRQTVLPLGVKVDKYGEKLPREEAHFEITEVRVGGERVEHTFVEDPYAPAQYFDLTEAQKLTAPAYQSFTSGLTAAPDQTKIGDRVSVRPQYEEVIVDTVRGHRQARAVRVSLEGGTLGRIHQRSAVAGAARMQRKNLAFPGRQRKVRVVSVR